jgi:hypothetical protein
LAFDDVSWVLVKLSGSPPARNSLTMPLTRTRSPICATGAALRKTKTASDVAMSASGVASWIHTPRPPAVRRAVTTPSTPLTFSPTRGEMCDAPCTSAIVAGGGSVVNEDEKSSAGASGGSVRSWSDTPAAAIVTVHGSSFARSVSGSSVKTVGPPEAVAATDPDVAQEISNHEPATFTGSLKVTSTFASTATFTVPFAGLTAMTAGAASPAIGLPPAWMSSTPTHSSLPAAFVVITRTCTSGLSFASAGRLTATGVVALARLGPVVASAM